MLIDRESKIELIRRVSNGDVRAFTQIFENFYPRVFNFAFEILQSEVLAKEVVQEVMLKVWQMGEKLNEIENFDSYIKTISKNRAIDILRMQKLRLKKGEEAGLDWEGSVNYTEEQMMLKEAKVILNEGIRRLTSQQKLIYNLIEVEGKTIELISKELNISIETVKTHHKLAKRNLRNYLKKNAILSVVAVLFGLF